MAVKTKIFLVCDGCESEGPAHDTQIEAEAAAIGLGWLFRKDAYSGRHYCANPKCESLGRQREVDHE